MFCQLYGKARDLTGSGLSSPPSVSIVSSIAQIAVDPASASTAASTCDGQLQFGARRQRLGQLAVIPSLWQARIFGLLK
jgi:hypothetical protein